MDHYYYFSPLTLLYHLFGVRLCYCECFCSASVLRSVYFLEIAVCFNLTHLREEHYIQQYCLLNKNPVAIKNKSIPFVSVPAFISTLVIKSLHFASGDIRVCQWFRGPNKMTYYCSPVIVNASFIIRSGLLIGRVWPYRRKEIILSCYILIC